MEKEGPLWVSSAGELLGVRQFVAWSVRFDFEDQTRFSKASIASLVVDGLIAQNNVVLRGWLQHQGVIVVGPPHSGRRNPPNEIIERLLRQFPTEVKQLADNLGFDAWNFTNREVRYVEEIKTLDNSNSW